MKTRSKISALLCLTSALMSVPAMAALYLGTSADCGVRESESSTVGSSYCSYSGSGYTGGDRSRFDFRIQAKAANGYELGGLRTFGEIIYDGLQEGRTGATSSSPALTYSVASLTDWFRFSLPDAAPNTQLTMRTVIRMHGTNDYTTVDESRFYDGNSASMISEMVVLGLGITSSHHQFHSSVGIANGAISILGSSDDTAVFEQSVTLNANNSFDSYVKLQLATTVRLVNGFIGSVGVGSGVLGADFSSTAGVVSIEFFDSNGGIVDYSLTTDGGEFAFLAPVTSVPEPSSSAMMLLGLCAVAGFAQRRRRSKAASAA